MKKILAAAGIAALLACVLIPGVSFTEDRNTVLLAKAIYALAHDESYETKLAIGTVVMNRVEDPWFGGTLESVLTQKHQFPTGSRYDGESLSAAHDVLSGTRVLGPDALYYRAVDALEPWPDETPLEVVGGYAFYAESGNR